MAVENNRCVDEAVAKITDDGAFGRDCELVSFVLDNRHTKQDQFASTVLYGTATVRGNDGLRDRRLVFKLKHQTPALRATFNNDSQFHNEILFYDRILPFMLSHVPAGERSVAAGRVPSLCRYFYGRNDCDDRASSDMIVLENECVRGYRMSDQQLFLDLDHLTVALTALARFHGLSYRAKHEDPDKFAELVADIKNTLVKDDGEYTAPDKMIEALLSVALDRLEERDADVERVNRFRTELSNGTGRMRRLALRPREPLAVLCHGDFNRNNLLFRYDDGDGTPADALAFDMATVRYASPAVDLSFFLYMNTDREMRDAHWDRLLDTYCAALAAAVLDVADVVRVPDRTQLDAEMREHAFHGLSQVSFYLRIMSEKQPDVNVEDYVDIDAEKMFRLLMKFGGDRATDLVADAVQFHLCLQNTDERLQRTSS